MAHRINIRARGSQHFTYSGRCVLVTDLAGHLTDPATTTSPDVASRRRKGPAPTCWAVPRPGSARSSGRKSPPLEPGSPRTRLDAMERTRLGVLVALFAALSLTACAPTSGRPQPSEPPGSTPSPGSSPSSTSSPSPAPSPSGIQHPTGADELVFRLSVAGGLSPPSSLLDLPQLSLYGDGGMITSDPAQDVFPRQMLPSLTVRQVTPAGIERLLSLAREAGVLDGDAHYDEPTIADAPTTTFVAVANGTRRVVSAYALGVRSDGETEPARAALLALRDALADLDTLLGPEIEPAAPYEIERLQIVIEPDGPIPDQDVTIVPWPLSADPATIGEPYPYGEDARCVVVSGAELRALQPELREPDELTRWYSDDLTYEFLLRPLLPDEAKCSDAIRGGSSR